MIHIIHLTATKVGGACSYLGSIGQKVGGALAPLALWLPRPWKHIVCTRVINIDNMRTLKENDSANATLSGNDE